MEIIAIINIIIKILIKIIILNNCENKNYKK